MADITPPELAHRRVIETDSMTLSIGSIFGDHSSVAGTLPHDNTSLEGLAPWGKNLRDASVYTYTMFLLHQVPEKTSWNDGLRHALARVFMDNFNLDDFLA